MADVKFDQDAYLKSLEKHCKSCGGVLLYIANLHAGNDTGYGAADLYQCESCKSVEAL